MKIIGYADREVYLPEARRFATREDGSVWSTNRVYRLVTSLSHPTTHERHGGFWPISYHRFKLLETREDARLHYLAAGYWVQSYDWPAEPTTGGWRVDADALMADDWAKRMEDYRRRVFGLVMPWGWLHPRRNDEGRERGEHLWRR